LGEVNVGSFDVWVATGFSDHVPLVVDVDVPDQKATTALNPERTVRTDLI